MGYRSEVKIAIQCNKAVVGANAGWKTFLCEIAVNPDTKIAYEELTSSDLKNCGIDEHTTVNRIWYEGDDVKWYDSYSDVQSWMALLEVAQGYQHLDEQLFSTAFIRIGEEDNDVETNYTSEGCELLSVYSSSSFDW
tara:strand:- start:3962 stop:4372 length:411 start_codon:yes stop_codon:yes gene_type:complete